MLGKVFTGNGHGLLFTVGDSRWLEWSWTSGPPTEQPTPPLCLETISLSSYNLYKHLPHSEYQAQLPVECSDEYGPHTAMFIKVIAQSTAGHIYFPFG